MSEMRGVLAGFQFGLSLGTMALLAPADLGRLIAAALLTVGGVLTLIVTPQSPR